MFLKIHEILIMSFFERRQRDHLSTYHHLNLLKHDCFDDSNFDHALNQHDHINIL